MLQPDDDAKKTVRAVRTINLFIRIVSIQAIIVRLWGTRTLPPPE